MYRKFSAWGGIPITTRQDHQLIKNDVAEEVFGIFAKYEQMNAVELARYIKYHHHEYEIVYDYGIGLKKWIPKRLFKDYK